MIKRGVHEYIIDLYRDVYKRISDNYENMNILANEAARTVLSHGVKSFTFPWEEDFTVPSASEEPQTGQEKEIESEEEGIPPSEEEYNPSEEDLGELSLSPAIKF